VESRYVIVADLPGDSALAGAAAGLPEDAPFDAWIERLEAGVHGSRASMSPSV
jgi:hypothetical protein